ncbi:unnamed protein product [Heterotrigona itama]|uniref:Uncharacterized protein n=1 Tax=Heterotrigona itama TaxID=395501 RepID=A0A6V7HCT6_9HYME|nr:unnamed protein product [Heterotrigona itama]
MQSKLHVDLRCFQIEATAATTAVAGSPLSWHIPRPSLVGRSERDSENGSWAHHLHPNSPSRGSTSSQGSTAKRRVGHVTPDSCKPSQSCSDSSAHGDGAETNGYRIGGEQYSLHCGERPRQTNNRLQEVLLREKSAYCARLHDELPIHDRSASRDSLHGNENSRQVPLGPMEIVKSNNRGSNWTNDETEECKLRDE